MNTPKRCTIRWPAAICAILLLAAPSLSAATIYVSTAGDDANDGLTWPTAKRSVQAGLNAAAPTDQVWVAAGTYVENVYGKRDVTLYGGFAGTETTLEQRNWTVNETILDGNQAGSVVTIPANATATTCIDGFTIRNGNGTLVESTRYGGGIYCYYASPTIANNTITGNSGGGIYCSSSAPTIINNTISGSVAPSHAAIHCYKSSAVITHNTITGNSSVGIFCASFSSATIVNNTINGNTNGGIGCWSSSSATIANNTITGNSTSSFGGGIYCNGSSPSIANNTIVANDARSLGGGIYCISGSPAIANNMIISNSALSGGGVYCSSSTATVTSNTIAGNNAADGGGIYCESGSSAIINTIVAFNSSGICTETGTPSLHSNCVYGNDAYNYSGLTDPSGTNGNISADPNLADLAHGNAHIQPSSPCIDAGDDTAIQPGWLDIDGQPRTAGSHVDIGADESDGMTWPTGPNVIVHVSPTGDDANDGSSWALAKKSVQAGIDAAAAPGGEVWVQASTYFERITLPSFTHIYGGFAGTETHRSQRDWLARVTIMDGSQAGSVVTALAGYRVSTIDGFTIRNGTGTVRSASSYRYGGGVFCSGGSPTIANNTIVANSASNRGGGIYCYSASPIIVGNTITNNNAGSAGGIGCESGSPMITNNRIADNTGGGITFEVGCQAMILNNTISGNVGGGINSMISYLTIANNTITGNRYVDGVTALYGGGIYCYGGSMTLINNTIAGNSANFGGGISVINCSLAMTNTLVAFNSSGIIGSAGAASFRNNCVYGNGGYNYSGLVDPTGTDGNISADPGLADLSYGNVHLQPGSPCIDAGDDSAVPTGWLDMDGQPRTAGPRVDIGADEADSTAWPPGPYAVVRVSPAGDDANDGSTWPLAKRTIQAALGAASAIGGDVWVQAGTYSECIALPPFAHLFGGFAGGETLCSSRDWSTNRAILDGRQAGSTIVALGLVAGLSTLDGFTIRNGSGTVSGSYLHGGGIYCCYASPTIAHCTITANTAAYGAGVYCTNSSPPIRDNILVGNAATSAGGGIYCTYSSPLISSNTIVSNSATGGGGICCSSSAATISNNIVSLNSTGIHRGGSPAPVIRYNCVFSNGTDYTGIADQTGLSGNISADPRFAAPSDPGPDGLWGTVDDVGYLHLQDDSPCRNMGDPTFTPAVGETDIDGQPRTMANRIDIGADEFTWPGDANLDGYVDVVDLLSLVYAFGTIAGDPAYDPACDFNDDGTVDVADLLDLVYNFGQ